MKDADVCYNCDELIEFFEIKDFDLTKALEDREVTVKCPKCKKMNVFYELMG